MRQRIFACIIVTAIVVTLLAPGIALAGASTDAALGLGAFAVFNQMLGGVGIFGSSPAVAVAPPPPVVVAPPPPPVVVVPYAYPTYYAYPAPVYYPYRAHYYAVPAKCPPGLAKQGRCGGWAYHRGRG